VLDPEPKPGPGTGATKTHFEQQIPPEREAPHQACSDLLAVHWTGDVEREVDIHPVRLGVRGKPLRFDAEPRSQGCHFRQLQIASRPER